MGEYPRGTFRFKKLCGSLWKGGTLRFADYSYAQAQYNLGICYKNGLGVEKSYDEAAKWFQLAAEKNYANAQYELGLYYISSYLSGNILDKETGIMWLKKAAESKSSVSTSAVKALQMLEVPGY